MSTTSTIGDALASHAVRDPDAPAIIYPGIDTLSFGDLERHIQRISAQLYSAGIGSSSRVGIALQRGPEAALLNVAICCTATVLPFNPNLPPADLKEELKRVRPDALVLPGDAAIPDWVTGGGDAFALFKVAKAISSFEEVALEQVRPIRHSKPPGQMTAQSWAAIFRTSGTTGPSKRVPVTHENLIEMAKKMERWLRLTPADRSACIMPIYYNAGFKATLLVPLLIGCSVAMPASTSPHDFDQWLSELRPTWLTGAPTFLQAVVEKLHERSGMPPHALRFVLSTASYLPERTRVELQHLLATPVVEFYGLGEAGMMTAPALPPEEARPGSVGRVPEGEFAIHDDQGRFLRPGLAGQVMLRGPSVMPGYLFDDIDGVPSGLQDGWLTTGDVGSIDEDGFLTIVGRTKEIINRGGEKIAPYDVEKALLCHPSVREAAAFALPHARLGENVGAAVVLHPDARATSTELIDFIYDRLAPFQRPRHVHIVESLPVGATGKISRAHLSLTFANHKKSTQQPAASLEIVIAEIWQRLLKRTDIGMDDDFFESGGDSLQATEMLLELEEVTRQRIAPSDVRAQLTIRVLSETLARVAAAKNEVMTRVKSGQGTPLFLCHGDFGGWGFYAFRLSEKLKGDGPVYLLHSLLDTPEGIETIEEMTRRYLPDVEAVAPTGPIRVAGYCHGGLAALELVRHLERKGRTVEKIVLVDTFSINARPLMRPIVRIVSLVSRFMPGALGREFRRRAMPSVWHFTNHMLNGDRAILRRVTKTVRTGSMQVWDTSRRSTYYRAMSKYLPSRIRAAMICLLCDEYFMKKGFETAPWKRLARDVRVDRIPGQHSTCITTHVDVLAERLNEVLAEQTAEQGAREANGTQPGFREVSAA
jgi:acyl-CoA synthetase (AMP-forming)/AMP-acid ligase II/thioesterase domain-containing protein/acyl carrier protein